MHCLGVSATISDFILIINLSLGFLSLLHISSSSVMVDSIFSIPGFHVSLGHFLVHCFCIPVFAWVYSPLPTVEIHT